VLPKAFGIPSAISLLVLTYVTSDVDVESSVSKLPPRLLPVGTERKPCGVPHCGDETLCGLVGRESLLSKLFFPLTSGSAAKFFVSKLSAGCNRGEVAVAGTVVGSGWGSIASEAEVSIVIVGARGRPAGASDDAVGLPYGDGAALLGSAIM
jgi:hypothetical protein